MTREQAEAHQRKHGFLPEGAWRTKEENALNRALGLHRDGAMNWDVKTPALKPVMNKTETEFSLILEAMKRRGEILRWEYEGVTLRWRDRETDELIRYTPDFYVVRAPGFHPVDAQDLIDVGVPWCQRLVEVKGGFTGGKFERAVERFRHARTRWPEFAFELHQKKAGAWRRVL